MDGTQTETNDKKWCRFKHLDPEVKLSPILSLLSLCVTLTQLQQGAYYLCLDVAQLAVELPLGRSQLVEAGDEAHHVPVGERHAPLTARKHIAHITQLEQKKTTHTHAFISFLATIDPLLSPFHWIIIKAFVTWVKATLK